MTKGALASTNKLVPPSFRISVEAKPAGDATSAASLSPLESWCVAHLNSLYAQAMGLRCPFWKRRAADMLDAMDELMRFLVIRHKSLPLVGPPAGWRCDGDDFAKSMHLTTNQIMEVISEDWKVDTCKGYYITGRLNTTIYRDDCFFDGPDPDQPVRGLRKYLNAASQLFDPTQSRAELLSIQSLATGDDDDDSCGDTIIVTWRINGVLRLPWRPTLPELTGSTRYERDQDGLIFKHVETWDVSVFQAFFRTFWPELARHYWK